MYKLGNVVYLKWEIIFIATEFKHGMNAIILLSNFKTICNGLCGQKIISPSNQIKHKKE